MKGFTFKYLVVTSHGYAGLVFSALFGLGGCASAEKGFMPKGHYPPDPWVKDYAQADDCLGGEKLAARAFELPAYPKRAFRNGQQGWVIIRLDVSDKGLTENVDIERELPQGQFGRSAVGAAKAWRFEPPEDGRLDNCRVLLRYRFGTVSLG